MNGPRKSRPFKGNYLFLPAARSTSSLVKAIMWLLNALFNPRDYWDWSGSKTLPASSRRKKLF